MLAEVRRQTGLHLGLAADMERAVDGLIGAVGRGDDRLGRAHLLVVERLVEGRDHPEGNARRVEFLADIGKIHRAEDLVEDREHQRGLGAAFVGRVEARIGRKIRPAERLDQAPGIA